MSTLDLKATSFSLTNARELALYARMAYDEPPTVCDTATDTQVLIRDLDDCLVVAFRGTSSLRDFITDAETWRDCTPLGGIHSGMWQAWSGVAMKLLQALAQYSFKPVLMTGHSLGGSLAMIAARVLRQNMVNAHSVYTFGAPRVGDKEFQTGYNTTSVPGSPFDNLGDATFTLIHDCDIVPRIPGWLAGFRRPGHDEFISALDAAKVVEDPSVVYRLESDVWSMFNAWRARQSPACLDKVLTDHRVDNYIKALAVIRGDEPAPTLPIHDAPNP